MAAVIVAGLMATALWFVAFGGLVWNSWSTGRDRPPPRLDAIGRRVTGAAKWGFIVGLGAWFTLSAVAALDLALGLGLNLVY